MNEEPRFMVESLSRWDFGWRLSQTAGPTVLPIPEDFHTTVDAIHHAKRLSDPRGCVLVLRIAAGWNNIDERERFIEIRHPATRAAGTPAK